MTHSISRRALFAGGASALALGALAAEQVEPGLIGRQLAQAPAGRSVQGGGAGAVQAQHRVGQRREQQPGVRDGSGGKAQVALRARAR